MIKLGTTPDSWGVWFPEEPRQIPWIQFLDESAVAGYKWIELGPFGYMPAEEPERMRAEIQRRGLGVTAGTIIQDFADPGARPAIEQEAVILGRVLAPLDAKYVVAIDAPYTDLFSGKRIGNTALDAQEWIRFVETIHHVADVIMKFGLQLVLHPHAQTRIEHEAQIDEFLERSDPSRVGLCLDVGHHAYTGGDPVAYLRKHHPRIPYLHLKSVDSTLAKKVEGDGMPFATAVAMGVFCEPSRGAIDFTALHAALNEVGYDGWGMVEQDMFPAPPDVPLPIAIRTREYLESLGFGNRSLAR